MSLESLFGRQEYFPSRIENFGVSPDYILRYRSFKSSPFYGKESGWMFSDEKSGAWIENIWHRDSGEIPRDWNLPTVAQLLAVLIESLDDPIAAKIRYDALKQSDFFTKERALWNSGYLDEGGWMKYDLTPKNQLIGVLVEACFDVDSAKRKYEFLKHTPLHNRETDEWQTISNYASRNELPEVILPLIIEGLLFDKDNAKSRYDKLKAEQITSGEGWLDISKRDRVYTNSLMYGILLEAVFNRDSAREYLNFLKETPLYDPKTKLWFRWWQKKTDKEGEFVPDVCDSEDQLLCVIIESIVN